MKSMSIPDKGIPPKELSMNLCRFGAAFILANLIGCNTEPAIVVQSPGLQIQSLFAINGSSTVTLGWTPVQNGTASALQVHRSSNPQFTPSSGTLRATLQTSDSTYLDTGLVNGSYYYYRVIPIEVFEGIPREGAASSVAEGRPFDYDSVAEISYSQHIQPIFRSGCAVSGCHNLGASGNSFAMRKTADVPSLSLVSWEDIFKGSDHGTVVVPYRANKSHMIFHINVDTVLAPVSEPHMPLPGINLPRNQLLTLMNWIDQGAPNDFGAIAFSTYPEGKVLATNQAEDVVSIIDVKTRLLARYVQAGLPRVLPGLQPAAPHNLFVDKAHDCYYVVLVAAGKVVKYRLSDNAKIAELSGVSLPTQVALSITGDTGFVSQFSATAHAIRMFDTRTMQLLPLSLSHPQLNKPHGVQITPDGKQIYITGNLSDNLIVYDIASGSLNAIWLNPANPVVGTTYQPYQTVMTKDNKFVYVSCQLTNEVRLISRDSSKFVKSIPVGTYPLIMDITPDGQYIYVANRNSNDVSVIRTSDNTVATTISNVGPQPHGVAIDSGGKYAYVTCENTGASSEPPHHPTSGSLAPGFIVVIDISTNSVVKTIEVSNFAAGIAVVD